MADEVFERIANLEKKLEVVEQSHLHLASQLREMQAESAQSRGEQKAVLTELNTKVDTLIRQEDLRTGAAAERAKYEAMLEKRANRLEKWAMLGAPSFILLVLYLLEKYVLDLVSRA